MLKINTGSVTTTGGRENNEDRCGSAHFTTGGHSYAVLFVADGMGGHANGEKAAQAAVTGLANDILDGLREIRDVPQVFGAVFENAERRVLKSSEGADDRRPPGTTLSVGLVDLTAGDCWLAWSGDSPAMLLRRDKKRQLGPEMRAKPHGFGNTLLRCLGGVRQRDHSYLPPEVIHHKVRSGDVVLIASDGLDPLVGCDDPKTAPDPLPETLRKLSKVALEKCSPEELSRVCRVLAASSDGAGNTDNCTIVLGAIR